MQKLFLCLLLVALPASADTLTGRVVSVSDGDTITVLDHEHQQHKIRMSGIDAPEKKQSFGQRSKENLSWLVYGKQVNVEWKKRDRYQRVIGKVMVANSACRKHDCPKTVDAGLSQVTSGLAWWYRQYAKEQSDEDRQRYEFAETDAKDKRSELWSEFEPTPPWEWRHPKKYQD